MPIRVFGGSHDDHIGLILSQFPAGVVLDLQAIRMNLAKRVAFKTGLSTRCEEDQFEIVSGVKDGLTTGDDLTFIIYNRDVDSDPYLKARGIMRPSHADYVSWVKYHEILIGGGAFSGRMTVLYIILGSICEQLLQKYPIRVFSRIKSIHVIKDPTEVIDYTTLDPLFPVADPVTRKKMIHLITSLTDDSVGGVIELCIQGVPIGLGDPVFGGLEAMFSQILFAIPGIKGIEFGSGFDITKKFGHEVNDLMKYVDEKVVFLSNYSGGIQGGVANGEDIIIRLAVKPTPSIRMPQQTINVLTKTNVTTSIEGRHDAAFIIKVVHVACAMATYAVAQALRGTPYER